MRRWFTGNIQMHLNLVEARRILIPLPSEKLKKEITALFTQYVRATEQSATEYREAERSMLDEVGFFGVKLSDENVSVRSLTEASKTERFDAEYWQPKYDETLAQIRDYKGGVSSVRAEFEIVKGNFKLQKGRNYRYIEIGDVSISDGSVEVTERPAEELPDNAKIEFGERQLIASKVRPNRGAVAILDKHKGYIGSGAFTVLKEIGRVPLEVLLVFLKSAPIRDLLLRYNIGTSYPVIRDEDILNLPLPVLDAKTTNTIVEKVAAARQQLSDAKHLIEQAKKAVEVFVERDEKAALKFIAEA
jgi:type I restriction enzyme S subunit